MKALRWFVPLQALVLLLLAPRLTLWLDEVLTLIGAAQPSLPALIDYIRTVPGGSLLAFLPLRWALQFGDSELAVRMPSILASLALAPAMVLLARRMGLGDSLSSLVLFAVLPLQLRYGLEARPYALALCLTMWLTVLFLERRWPVLYVALAVGAAMTQPYAAFVVVAHFVWALRTDRGQCIVPGIALGACAAALLPWYSYFRHDWSGVNAAQGIAMWDSRALLVFVHEIAGSGYVGAVLLLTGAVLGIRRTKESFWVVCILVPLLAALAANVVFHYFFSVRQVIYVLPVLALLFVAGVQPLGRVGQVLLAGLLAASLVADVQWFRKPREDWRSAADVAALHVQSGGCMVFLGDSTPLYLYFRPELGTHRCGDAAQRVVVGVTPYFEDQSYPAMVAQLQARGLHKQAVQEFGGPRIEVFAP